MLVDNMGRIDRQLGPSFSRVICLDLNNECTVRRVSDGQRAQQWN
jgi:hypothetical protein